MSLRPTGYEFDSYLVYVLYVFLGVNLEGKVGPTGFEPVTWRITAIFLPVLIISYY